MTETMRASTPSGRIENIGKTSAHCPYCCDEGWVIVALVEALRMTRKDGMYVPVRDEAGEPEVLGHHEEMGPCPACLKGERIEFPRMEATFGPWGSQGYWRGRPWHLYIKETCTCRAPVSEKVPQEYLDLVARLKGRTAELQAEEEERKRRREAADRATAAAPIAPPPEAPTSGPLPAAPQTASDVPGWAE